MARRIVLLACQAPSVYNTQPWAWRLRPDGLDLYADHQRRLPVADPTGRELVLSCGAALHHAQVAARALGWEPTVRRFPDPSAPALLAEVRLAPALPPRSAAADIRAVHERSTDRRRFTSWPVPDERLERLAAEAREWDTDAVAITDVTDRFRIDLLVGRAHQLQARDPDVLAEQQQWLDRPRGDGVPTATVPDRPAPDPSHRSRFGVGSLEDAGRDLEGTDGLVVLCAEEDDAASLAARRRGTQRALAARRPPGPLGRPALAGRRGRRDPRCLAARGVRRTRRAAAPAARGMAGDQPQPPGGDPATPAGPGPAAVTPRLRDQRPA